MVDLRLYVFGPPRLEHDGQTVELNLRKSLALLIYLAVSDQPHSRDTLAALLWPESDQREGRTRLRRVLHRLQQALGDAILDAGPEIIRLQPSIRLWVDSAAFRQHVRAGLPATASGALTPERLAHLAAAVDLYSADFLAGFTLPDSPAFDEWQFFQRESLQQLYGQALEQLIAAQGPAGAWETAIGYARRWVALDPLHEPAQRALMQLYALAGQPAAAQRQYQEYARLLAAELDVAPEEATTELYEAIRTRQFAPRDAPEDGLAVQAEPRLAVAPARAQAPRPAAPPPSARADDTQTADAEASVFVARQPELARLGALLDLTLAEQQRVAFVAGEAGQGKTALLQAFAQLAQQAHPELIVAGGNCAAYTGAGDPYLPFREILELLTGDLESRGAAGILRRDQARRLSQILPAAVQALAEHGPDLLDTFIAAPRLLSRSAGYAPAGAAWLASLQQLLGRRSASLAASPQQQDLFEQYTRVLQALARQTPLLLIVDDLHWADLGSINLLFHLGRRLAGHRVLIVGAFRPAELAASGASEPHPLERLINEFQRAFGEIVVDLSQAAGRAFVDALLDAEPNELAEDFRATLYQQTGGHPLFTIELLRELQRQGALARDPAGRLVVRASLDWTALPARVEGAIAAHIGRLPTALRRLLQTASVAGAEFAAEVVARMLGAEEREVVRQLSGELDQTHHLVQAIGVKREGLVRLSLYRFRHILFQRYLYQGLDAIERAYLNEALGQALEDIYGDQAEQVAVQLAWHYQAADRPHKAIHYLLLAGRSAARISAHEEAIAHLRQGLELLEALPDTPERARQELALLAALGPSLTAKKSYASPEAASIYTRARNLCVQVGDTQYLLPVLWGLWRTCVVGQKLAQASEVLDQLFDLAQRRQDPAMLIVAHSAKAITLFYVGDLHGVRSHADQAIAHYDPQLQEALAFSFGQNPCVMGLNFGALALWLLGYPDQAAQRADTAVAVAQDEPFSRAYALDGANVVAQFRGDWAASKTLAEQGIAISTKHGNRWMLGMNTFMLGRALVEQGQLDAGLAQMREALEIWRSTGRQRPGPYYLALLAEAYRTAGLVEEGLETLAEALALVERTQERWYAAELYRLRGHFLSLQGQPESESEACFGQALDLARAQQAKSLELRSAISLARVWQRQGKPAKARRLLTELYGWFAEGFDTADLREARALIAELAGEEPEPAADAQDIWPTNAGSQQPEQPPPLAEIADRPAAPSAAQAPAADDPASPARPSAPAAQGERSGDLLATKLFVPRPRQGAVPRPRLLARLDAARSTPLTLVSAPAGFGKTTLLAEWLAPMRLEARALRAEDGKQVASLKSQAPHLAWISLDGGDNDLTAFMRYLIAAFQNVAPSVGSRLSALAQAPQPPAPEALLRMLLNELAALPHDVLLVLDDYHLITTPAIHATVAALLERLPPTLRLLIATRADPPLPLARMRARGEVVELRAADLRFTLDEVRLFLGEVMGFALAADDIAALEARTEGWIAGLQLAALAMRERGDLAGFVSAFTGSNRFVVDYLAEEVLNRQPRHLQTFLLQTAILGRMCGPLCDAVLGLETRGLGLEQGTPSPQPQAPNPSSYSQLILEQLERANLFLVALDDQRQWYRYHHLFGAVLRERLLAGATAAEIERLHQRASAWYANHDLIEEAIQHALAAKMPERAAQLIEQRAEALIIGSEMTMLQRWIAQLPEKIVFGRRRLALAYAGVQLALGQVAAVEPLLQAGQRAPLPDEGDHLPGTTDTQAGALDRGWLDDLAGYTAAMRSIVARIHGDLASAIALAHAALERLPKRFRFMRSAATWNLGMAYWLDGDLAAADDIFAAVLADNQDSSQIYGFTSATSSLGQVRVVRGRLREAAQLYRHALEHAARLRAQIPSVGILHVRLGEVLREWNELASATRHLTDGIALGELFGSAELLEAAYTTLARVKQAQGDHAAAAGLLAQARQFTPGLVFTLDSSQQARAWLAQGDSLAAASWATRNGVDSRTPPGYRHEAEQIVLARVLLAQAASAEALGLLEPLLAAAEAGGRTGAVIEALALLALAHSARGDSQRALAALRRALALAEPEGYARIFVDEGAPMADLLAALCRQPPARQRGYIAALLAALGPSAAGASPNTQSASALIEPLSEREREVLSLIAAGLSNQAIAARLVVGVSTVKKHINNIFGKLAVQSRTQALARARELGLL